MVTWKDGQWSNAAEDPIEIADYDPSWPASFEAEAVAIRQALAGFGELSVEHIGSTAVPGLAAKPVVDVMVVIADESRWPAVVAPLEGLGYAYWLDDPRPKRMFFVKGMPPFGTRRTHHVHVMLPDEAVRRRLFRDHLAARPDEAACYVALKRDLAARFTHDREAYTDGKARFIADALVRAASASVGR